MSEKSYPIFKQTDSELITSLKKIISVIQNCESFKWDISLLPGDTVAVGRYDSIINDKNLIALKDLNSYLLSIIRIELDPNNVISVTRGEPSDVLLLKFNTNQFPIDIRIKILNEVEKHIKFYIRTNELDKLLGNELAEFYRKREQALLKLEDLSQQIIKKNEDYREATHKEFDELKKRLNDNIEEERNQLKEEFELKEQKLKDREIELEMRSKEIDDSDNRTARRKIRLDLKESLKESNKNFTLTESTNKKRNLIHGLFGFLIAVPSIYIIIEVATIINSGSCSWADMARLGISSIAWFSAIIFYIRWNDLWFRQHADEEFKLKRLELDIDRASWVVEMTHEWKEEKGNDIPAKLIESLTRNLFEVDNTSKTTKHPTEDLASSLFGAASNLTVKIPGFGEATLSKNDVKKFKEATEKSNNA